MDIDSRFRDGVQHFWSTRDAQRPKQRESGREDAGLRGAVTGGAQMRELERLVVDLLIEAGLDALDVRTRTSLELPGYFRPTKKWDLLVVSNGQLVTAIEFKSQTAPSFGNNVNNRAEEAIGNATDIWTAYREGRFGHGPRPFLGYFFLLEDCPPVRQRVRNKEPLFAVDPVFKVASYSQRYEILCRRLVLERLYDTACFTLSTNEPNTQISHPADDLTFHRFVAELQGHAQRFVQQKRFDG